MQQFFRTAPRIGVLILCAFLSQPTEPATAQAQPADCRLAQAALCETFDSPSALGAGTRAGNLDGVLWGVSRATNADNPSQGQLYRWAAATRSTCGPTETVAPPRDVAICNGHMVDTVNDNGQDTILAAYPRQPFDIAGRTGIATFDVNDDSQGPHAAWPAFVYTDQPVPAPYGQAAGLANTPRNSFGFSIASPDCGGDKGMTGVDSMWTTASYQFKEQSFSSVGCVQRASNTTELNHFEVHLSQSDAEVWGTDPGSMTLKKLAVASFTMPLTRGLIWIEDIHYNANKFNSQGNHTFVWDNVGFDGPVLPRDLGFDVLDATHDGTSAGDLGFLIPSGRSLTLQIPDVTSLENASAALLEFTFWPHTADSVTYAFNGNPAHSQAWPYGSDGASYVSQSIALPVPLGELHTGTNSVVLTSSDTVNGGLSVANIDLILVAAGAGPGAAAPPTQTPPSTDATVSMPPPAATPSSAAASAPVQAPPAPIDWHVLASINPSQGGSLVSADGVFSLRVPAGSAGDTLNVSLAASDPRTPTTNLQIGDHAYALVVTDSLGDPVSRFDTPLVLSIFTPTGGDPATLQVLALDAASQALAPLPASTNDDGSVSVLLPALAPPPAADSSQV